MGKHGGKPPYPLTYDEDGVAQKDSLCGEHNLCEHVLSGKTASSTVCENNKFHHPSIGYRKKRCFHQQTRGQE